jgi:hypothetical protein
VPVRLVSDVVQIGTLRSVAVRLLWNKRLFFASLFYSSCSHEIISYFPSVFPPLADEPFVYLQGTAWNVVTQTFTRMPMHFTKAEFLQCEDM